MKKCCHCGSVKPFFDFNKHSQKKDGYSPRCRDCHKKGIRHRVALYKALRIAIDKQECSQCLITKKLEFFHKSQTNKNGIRQPCKSCFSKNAKLLRQQNPERLIKENKRSAKWRRNNRHLVQKIAKKSWLKNMYGLSVEEYDKMRLSQGYACNICGKLEKNLKKGLAIDHDHTSGKIRALLCHLCNTGIGNFQESSTMLKKAACYLENYSKN